MKLPIYYVEAALDRLRADHSPANLRKLLALLGLDLVEPGPEPDFDDLATKARIEKPENEHHGSITFAVELSLFGHRVPVHFRYAYAGEFDEDGFFGSVSELAALTWPGEGRRPEWSQIDIGVLSRPMLELIDELVLDQLTGKSTQ